ncbi:MAG: hypothetical protein J6A43_02610 [Clostridia bacterium]|nr:hypothetical protein [Clostridia bacterium]
MTHKKKMFYITCSAYILTVILDLLFTYIATPNLLLEGNPLYDMLDFGWAGLIFINVVTTIGYIFMSYYAFIKYKPPVTNETDLKRYLAHINYGDPDKYVPMMWKLPKNWGPQTACLCWSIVCVLPFCRMIIVAEWFLMILKIQNMGTAIFFYIVSLFPLGRIDIFLAVIGAWILSFVWIQKEFKANLKEIEKRKTSEVA